MVHAKSRRLVFQPKSYASLQSGANLIINAVTPTLGPLPRITAVDRILDNRPAERLDSGGVIAKRIIQTPDRDADVGAMFVREFLWQLEDQEGDGTATAAVLFKAVFDEGVRHVAAGYNARLLQTHLEAGVRLILDVLSEQTVPVSGQDAIAKIARTICHDEELSEYLGEILDIVGEFGRLEIRKGETRGLKREYVEGMYWDKGLMSRELITKAPATRVELEQPAIVISDLKIAEAEELLPVLTCALKNDMRKLIIVASEISGPALGFLVANSKKSEELQVIAVRTPGYGSEEQAWSTTDLVALCGGRAFIQAAGDSLRSIRPEHFGHARRGWAEFRSFGIVGGKGDPRQLRQHIAGIRDAHDNTLDIVRRNKLHQRVGKLLGGSATLRIGGATETEMDERLEVAERTASAIRGALREGVVPGGGAAFLKCQPALLERKRLASSQEEAVAYSILASAMATPMRAIAHNSGYDASDVMAMVRLSTNGDGFDVLSGQVTDMVVAGIVDSGSVVKAAAYTGISSAALALTIDVLVHRRQEPAPAQPRAPGSRKRL